MERVDRGGQNTKYPTLAEGISKGLDEVPTWMRCQLSRRLKEEWHFVETGDFTGGFQSVVHTPPSSSTPVNLFECKLVSPTPLLVTLKLLSVGSSNLSLTSPSG